MISEEKIAWLRLLRTPKIGRVTFFHLLNYFKSALAAVDGLNDYLLKIGRKSKYIISSKESVMKFLETCSKASVELVFSSDNDYPKEFLFSSDFPPVLYCKGNIKLLNKDALAVVGSRTASLQGISFTKKLIKDLHGLTIISGFARGIDTAAHEASLCNGTIAVLGSGVTFVYPEENAVLYKKILENNGLIVSEIGLNDSPKPNFFAYRNRVISGLSKGVLVIEASMNSGSLITAKYAVEQGKNVFAVPGHPYDIRAHGTNYLLKNGAIFVRNADDILSEFYSYTCRVSQPLSFEVAESVDIEEVKSSIFNSLDGVSMTISEIVSFSNYPISIVNAALAELELLGHISIDQNLVKKTLYYKQTT